MGFLGKALINAVNPRLTLYTRAAFLAILIHSSTMVYAVVILLAYFLMGNCQTDAQRAPRPARRGAKKKERTRRSQR